MADTSSTSPHSTGKLRWNFRVIFVLIALLVLATITILREQGPWILRPGLQLYAYVANTADGTLTVVDLARLAAVATIDVGPEPSGVRANPKRDEIWGVSTAGGYVWVLDAKLSRVVARIPVGSQPYALDFSPDGARAYVAASGSNTVVAIDCASRQIVARGKAGRRPWIARVTPSGKVVVVTNRDDATVTLLDARTLAQIAVIPVATQPEQVAILPDSTKAFISSGNSRRISVVDLRKPTAAGKPALIANLELDGTAGDFVVKPDGGELYIPSPDAHGLVIVSTWTNEVSDYVLAGSAPARAILSPDGQTLYVADPAANHVAAIQIAFRQVLQHPVTTGQQPMTMAFTPVGDTLLVVDAGSDDLAVIRTTGCSTVQGASSDCLTTLIPVGHEPRDLAIILF